VELSLNILKLGEGRIINSISALNYDGGMSASYCVIGSGPAGGVVAAELVKQGQDVIVIEAGGEKEASSFNTVVDKTIVGQVDLTLGRAFQLGGSSNLWAGRVAPLDPIDFEYRNWVDNITWPMSRKSLDPYYRRAIELLGLSSEAFEDNYYAVNDKKFKRLFDGNQTTLKPFVWSKPPFRIADYILGYVSSETGSLRLLTDAIVGELESDPAGNIKAALVTCKNGNHIRVEARYFILAAGGLEVPRIMLNSNGVFKDGIGNKNGLVGRFLSTHPKADLAVLKLKRPIFTSNALFSDQSFKGNSVRLGISLSRDVQTAEKLLNHYIQLSSFSEIQANRAFELIKKKVYSSKFITREQVNGRLFRNLGLWVFNRIGRVAKVQPLAGSLIVRGFLDQYPDPDNCVRLSSELDDMGLRKIEVNWRYTDRDKKSVIDFLKKLAHEFSRHDIGELDYSGLESLKEWRLNAMHSHYLGTTRMSSDANLGVVDENCQVYGCENLFVAGPSIFTTYGNANPFLTICAFSMRLADHFAGIRDKNL